MKFFNICSKRQYQKNGETKVVWLNCGTMKELDDGKRFLELNMFPDTSFYIFEQKSKDQQQKLPGDWDA